MRQACNVDSVLQRSKLPQDQRTLHGFEQLLSARTLVRWLGYNFFILLFKTQLFQMRFSLKLTRKGVFLMLQEQEGEERASPIANPNRMTIGYFCLFDLGFFMANPWRLTRACWKSQGIITLDSKMKTTAAKYCSLMASPPSSALSAGSLKGPSYSSIEMPGIEPRNWTSAYNAEAPSLNYISHHLSEHWWEWKIWTTDGLKRSTCSAHWKCTHQRTQYHH